MKKYKAPSYPPVGNSITNPFANLPTKEQFDYQKKQELIEMRRKIMYKVNNGINPSSKKGN